MRATPGGILTSFAVAGWGIALPERRVTNAELAARIDTTDEWIVARTGIRERRVSGAGDSTGTLALGAARQALASAQLEPAQVDLVIVATCTPDRMIPSTAATVVAALATSAGAFDINAACAGFVHGLAATAGLIRSGIVRTVLLVGAESTARIADPDDRSTAVLFGDGAGAAVLTAHDGSSSGLVACDLVNDPGGIDLLVQPAGGHLRMDGPEVFRRAVRAAAESIDRTLTRAGSRPEDVTLFVPHQANARISEALLARIGIPTDRTLSTVHQHANTSSASIPLALAEPVAEGRLADDDLVLVCGFGAGLTVATALWRWARHAPTPPH